MSEIAGRTVLVTGGASGMGRLLAYKTAARGANVVLWDINRENLDRVLAEVTAIQSARGPARAAGYLCNVSDRADVYEKARRVTEEVGPVDILISSAGIVSGKRLLEIPDEKIEATFAVNTLALFWTAKAFLPHMIAQDRGHIVTLASASGFVGVSKLSDYSSSKWAAVGFDESLRMELRQIAPGVKTTVVCPYYVNTGMFEGVKTRFRFLLPILNEDRVAERIVRAIERDRRRVIMPPIIYAIPLMRILPVSVFDAVTRFFGVSASMDEFTGRNGAG